MITDLERDLYLAADEAKEIVNASREEMKMRLARGSRILEQVFWARVRQVPMEDAILHLHQSYGKETPTQEPKPFFINGVPVRFDTRCLEPDLPETDKERVGRARNEEIGGDFYSAL